MIKYAELSPEWQQAGLEKIDFRPLLELRTCRSKNSLTDLGKAQIVMPLIFLISLMTRSIDCQLTQGIRYLDWLG